MQEAGVVLAGFLTVAVLYFVFKTSGSKHKKHA